MIQSELKKKMNLLSWNRHSLKITIYSSNSKQVIQSLENGFFFLKEGVDIDFVVPYVCPMTSFFGPTLHYTYYDYSFPRIKRSSCLVTDVVCMCVGVITIFPLVSYCILSVSENDIAINSTQVSDLK